MTATETSLDELFADSTVADPHPYYRRLRRDDPVHEIAGTGTYVVTSVGIQPSAGYSKFLSGATGFWASAGPDGDFTKGDDNIYSFEGF